MNLHRPSVLLVGTGVVGRAILQAHLEAGVSLQIADLDPQSVRAAIEQADLDPRLWNVSAVDQKDQPIPLASAAVTRRGEIASDLPLVLIESISEKLEVKRDFFRDASRRLPADAVLGTNTSTLRIAQIAEGNPAAERILGIHFFMPVRGRPAVELVRGPQTSEAVIAAASDHLQRIGKTPLHVSDSPGFIVNRLLSPYLNEAMLLLCRGVSAAQLERAALSYGMPMSPLELIDWIGTRTMFDAGRAFWQAFPARFDPAPVLGAMIKARRGGRGTGGGFYDYVGGVRGTELPAEVAELCRRYERHPVTLDDDQVMMLLAIPMWIEAAHAYRDGVVASPADFELAMHGGLAYRHRRGWLGFFDEIGSERILEFIERNAAESKSLRISDTLKALLGEHPPTACLKKFG